MSVTDHESFAQSASESLALASRLMLDFAERTGLTSDEPGRRYLWTDAFAVCNFLELARATGDGGYADLARRLVDRVHHELGRHRPDDARSGWLSGLEGAEAERHPTLGGLRIGKLLPERSETEPLDEELEWERDGQYFHYLTQWMHALDQTARRLRQGHFNVWARELARTACRAFALRGGMGLAWKMRIDLSRPALPAASPHDPLDGFVTCAMLRRTADELGIATQGPDLSLELTALEAMLGGAVWVTADPLGIGGLLVQAARLSQLAAARALDETDLLTRVLTDALAGLEVYAASARMHAPAERRLAFRELGLAIGLSGIRFMGAADPRLRHALDAYTPLGAAIERFWLEPRARRAKTWAEHRDINDVMLATRLAPDGYLAR